MKRTYLFVIVAGAALLAGCDPGPSVPIAPDAKMPDTSKMSQEEIMKLREEGRKSER
ncbi:MAG: hypothetical protein ACO1SV_09035 [Fimbriimonas sp.]